VTRYIIIALALSLVLNFFVIYNNQKILNHTKDEEVMDHKLFDVDLLSTLRIDEIEAELNMNNNDGLDSTSIVMDLFDDKLDCCWQLLVFRFNSTNCKPCIDVEIANLKLAKNWNPNLKVLFLVNGFNPREVVDLKRELLLLGDVKQYSSLLLPSNLEQYAKPYYFVLQRNGHCFSVFIPNPQMEKLTERYLKLFSNL